MVFHPFGEFDQRDLLHYECQKNRPNYSENDSQKELVKARAKQECNTLCNTLFFFVFYNQLQVHMSIEEKVHWFVPFTVELLKSVAIPPIFVKLSMFELAYLSKKVTYILENEVKTENYESSAW